LGAGDESELKERVGQDALPGRLPAAVKCFQFRDLRAKAGTDKADATDMREAQQQLVHKSVKTTGIYLRARAGEKVTPTK
jgi:integrase